MKTGLLKLFLVSAAMVGLTAQAQTMLVKNHKAPGRILYTDTLDRQAAELLQDFTQRISGATMPIVAIDAKPKKGDVVFRRTRNEAIKEDGFKLDSRPGYLTIESNKGKGSVYGVVTLLEKYLGCNYWGENEYTVPTRSTIEIPAECFVENPTFTFRSNGSYAT